MPGQTSQCRSRCRPPSFAASMEGRAIARPNLLPAQELAGGDVASMEGRAIARPNLLPAQELAGGDVASMEGRAIARPNKSLAMGRQALLW